MFLIRGSIRRCVLSSSVSVAGFVFSCFGDGGVRQHVVGPANRWSALCELQVDVRRWFKGFKLVRRQEGHAPILVEMKARVLRK